MKHFLPLAATLLALSPLAAQAQVGVGTTTPDAKSALDIRATDKGLLIPRLTAAQRTAIASPPQGLMVYQTDGTASGGAQTGFWYYVGTGGWVFLSPTGDNLGNHTATQDLNLQGNALTGTGSNLGSTVGLGVRADGGLNLGQNTSGNLFVGYQAGQSTTPNSGLEQGVGNMFSGYQAGQANTTGSYNLFSGYQSGYANTTGGGNLFSGYQSGNSNTTGSSNLFSGYRSGYNNTSGEKNVFVGNYSGVYNTTGNDNVFSGVSSGYTNATGSDNVFSGYRSGFSNTTGSYNLFSGTQSGYSNTMGIDNLFSGHQSGYSNTTGSDNLFTGHRSGYNNTTGGGNLFSGTQSGYANTTGGDNVFSGYRSGYNNTTGSDNLFSGTQSGYNNTTGYGNLFSGAYSGYANTTGSNNTTLGYNSGPGLDYPGLTNATALGANVLLTRSNTVVLGNNANVGIGTNAPGQKLDVVGAVRTGTATTPATVYGNPTGTNNLLAVAYGQLGSAGPTTYATSGNYTLTRNGAGNYTITFSITSGVGGTNSGLSSTNLDNAAVVATLYGSAPGFINWRGGTGTITFFTYDQSGTAADRIFTFSVFTP